MKKIILVAFLLLPIICFSQTKKPIDSFLGIKFGSTKDQVIKALKGRAELISSSTKDPNSVKFMKVEFDKNKAFSLEVKFVDGKAYEAAFTFMANPDNDAQNIYKGLVNYIAEVHGDVPVNDAASSMRTWLADNGNLIGIFINGEIFINLYYRDYALGSQSDAK